MIQPTSPASPVSLLGSPGRVASQATLQDPHIFLSVNLAAISHDLTSKKNGGYIMANNGYMMVIVMDDNC